jgi:hypothetical protein
MEPIHVTLSGDLSGEYVVEDRLEDGRVLLRPEPPMTEERRKALLESLAEIFMKPETAGIDWDLLRESKLHAQPHP